MIKLSKKKKSIFKLIMEGKLTIVYKWLSLELGLHNSIIFFFFNF